MYLYGACSFCSCAVLFALEALVPRLLDEVTVAAGLALARPAEVDLPARASLPEKEAVHRGCSLVRLSTGVSGRERESRVLAKLSEVRSRVGVLSSL